MNKIFIAVIFFASCTQQQDLSRQSVEQIINADKMMSGLASKEGFHKALLQYADDSVMKPNEGELPVIGKKTLGNYWSAKNDTKGITWEPFKAEAAISGELGYTFGNWKYAIKDTILYGNYYTIWKKQKDGSWKFVIDGGNNTPKP